MKIGFIGLGTMGGSIALNIRKAGHEMVVHDIRREAGARHLEMGCEWADSPREVAAVCQLVFTSLPGPKEVEAVATGEDGLLDGFEPGAAWFDLSTNSPTVMRRLHAVFAERGISVLDSPVSGGSKGAITGQLAIWVGGDQEVYDRYKPVLDDFGDQPKYIGAIGSGTIAKLVHNCAGYAMTTALVEVFTVGVKAGVEPLELWDAIRNGSAGRQRMFDRLGGQILQGEFDPPSFALDLMFKDVSLATELGREVGVPMRIANLVHEELQEAMNRGWAKRDSRAGMLLQEERAGLDFHERREDVEEVQRRG
jgi:3-hydroxyisobutyrate dehydrogenase